VVAEAAPLVAAPVAAGALELLLLQPVMTTAAAALSAASFMALLDMRWVSLIDGRGDWTDDGRRYVVRVNIKGRRPEGKGDSATVRSRSLIVTEMRC
jgi:hypothetical protein